MRVNRSHVGGAALLSAGLFGSIQGVVGASASTQQAVPIDGVPNALTQLLGWAIVGIVADPDELSTIAANINTSNGTKSAGGLDLKILKSIIGAGTPYPNHPYDAILDATAHLNNTYTTIFIDTVEAAQPSTLYNLGLWNTCAYLGSRNALEDQQVSWDNVWTRMCDATQTRPLPTSTPFKGNMAALIDARSRLIANLWQVNLPNAADMTHFCGWFYNTGSYGENSQRLGLHQGQIRSVLCEGQSPTTLASAAAGLAEVKKQLTAYFTEQLLGVTDDPLWYSYFCQNTDADSLSTIGYDGAAVKSSACAAYVRVFGQAPPGS